MESHGVNHPFLHRIEDFRGGPNLLADGHPIFEIFPQQNQQVTRSDWTCPGPVSVNR